MGQEIYGRLENYGSISSIFDQQNYFLSYYFQYFTTIIILYGNLPEFSTGLVFTGPKAEIWIYLSTLEYF